MQLSFSISLVIEIIFDVIGDLYEAMILAVPSEFFLGGNRAVGVVIIYVADVSILEMKDGVSDIVAKAGAISLESFFFIEIAIDEIEVVPKPCRYVRFRIKALRKALIILIHGFFARITQVKRSALVQLLEEFIDMVDEFVVV